MRQNYPNTQFDHRVDHLGCVEAILLIKVVLYQMKTRRAKGMPDKLFLTPALPDCRLSKQLSSAHSGGSAPRKAVDLDH